MSNKLLMADPNLECIAENIGELLSSITAYSVSGEALGNMGINMVKRLRKGVETTRSNREIGKLWASDLGETCMRRLWFKFHEPGAEELITSSNKIKFLYGDLIEEIILYLMEEAGYKVEQRQYRVEHRVAGWTVSGRIDAIVDGRLVDVKSTSSFGFKKYAGTRLTPAMDSFGYNSQLSFYRAAIPTTMINPLKTPGFIWVDKQLGHVSFGEAAIEDVDKVRKKMEQSINTLSQDVAPPVEPRVVAAKLVAGDNVALGTKCSYCGFKDKCHNYKMYNYSTGPVFITNVIKEPRVPLIKENKLA